MRGLFLKLRAKFSLAPIAILIMNGKAIRVKGRLSQKLLGEFTQIAQSKNVQEGLITVVSEGGTPSLRFKGSFDSSAKQRFRNVWFSQS